MCLADRALDDARQHRFRQVAEILAAIFHHEAHDKLEELATAYRPFNPDGDARIIRSYTDSEKQELQRQLVDDLSTVLIAANYEPIPRPELEAALNAHSMFKLRVEINFDDFDELLFFRRGQTTTEETVSTWRGLRSESITVDSYDRVLMYVKFREQGHFDAAGRTNLRFAAGSTIIKLFQSVPVADLEMLVPNAEPRMRTIDKLTMGVPALIGGFVMLFTKLKVLTSLFLIALFVASRVGLRDDDPTIDAAALVALMVGLVTLGSFVWRQWNNVKNQRIAFMKELTENLYFRNLDNDAGVLHHLLAAAEEEETKESLVAYYFLISSPTIGPGVSSSVAALDQHIEAWFHDEWNCDVDFEIADALAKLERLGLVTLNGDRVAAVDETTALIGLSQHWDRFFDHDIALAPQQGSDRSQVDAEDRVGAGPDLKGWALRQLGRFRRDTGTSADGSNGASAGRDL